MDYYKYQMAFDKYKSLIRNLSHKATKRIIWPYAHIWLYNLQDQKLEYKDISQTNCSLISSYIYT